jgi:DNA-binding MarR family transcriptional regulator
MSDRAPTYVRLMNMLNAIRGLSPFSELSADEERLLGDLIVRWHLTPTITVSDLMESGVTPSSSTTYRRLIALRDKGLISMRVDQQDRRIKFVEPTAAARDYMQRINRSIRAMLDDERTV